MRHYYSPSLIVTVAVVGGLIGFGIGRMFPGDVSPPPGANAKATTPPAATQAVAEIPKSDVDASPARADSEKLAALSVSEWVRRITTHDPNKFDSATIRELARRLKDDAFLRRELIRRYDLESDARIKSRIIDGLALSPMQDVVHFSLRLIDSSNDTHRKNGFELLSAVPPTPEIYREVTQAIDLERSPDVLRQAVAALSPSMVISPADTQAMIARLGHLTQHSDASVRTESLRMLAQWDKAGKTASGAAVRALTDTSPDVRKAGIGMVFTGQLRSDSVKTGLINVLRNHTENPDIRLNALRALEGFALNNEEYAAYTQARIETEKLSQNTR